MPALLGRRQRVRLQRQPIFKALPVRARRRGRQGRGRALKATINERLKHLIAERAGDAPKRVVRGTAKDWDAVLIVNQVGNAERRRFVVDSIVRSVKSVTLVAGS